MAVLFEASSSHRSSAAIQIAETNGKQNRHTAQPMAPMMKKGLRRPQRSLHVRSESAPMSGWMNRPVIGPAMLSRGSSSAEAPRKL